MRPRTAIRLHAAERGMRGNWSRQRSRKAASAYHHRRPLQRSPHCAASKASARFHARREPVAGRSPGSSVLTARLPVVALRLKALRQWRMGRPALAYRCGGSRGLARYELRATPHSRFTRREEFATDTCVAIFYRRKAESDGSDSTFCGGAFPKRSIGTRIESGPESDPRLTRV